MTSEERPPQAATVPRNVLALSAVSFFRDVASEMLVHLVPLFLVNGLGARTVMVGLIEGVAEATSSLTRIVSGWLSDRWGRRKELAVLGYAVAAAAVPVLALARSWPAVLVARFGDRLGKGIRTAPRDALIADSVTGRRRGLGFGLHRAADSGGALVGLLLAMLIVWRLQGTGSELQERTFRVVATWAVVPATAAVAVLALGVREIRAAPSTRPLGLSLAGLDGRFRRFLIVMVVFTLGNSSDAFLVVRSQDAGFSVLAVLGMVAVFNLVYAVAATPAGALSDRVERRRLVAAGWLIYTAVYVGFAFAGDASLWLLWALYGLYHALTEGVSKAMVADMVASPAERGTAFGVYGAAVGVSALPASVIAGTLWQGVGPWAGLGPRAPFLFGAAMALTAAVLLLRWAR